MGPQFIDSSTPWYNTPLPMRYARASDADGVWRTIGGTIVEQEDGTRRRHGGSRVFIRNGKIEKGAPGLVGRKISAMKEPPEESSHRKDLNREKGYRRAVFAKRAREAGVDPESVLRLTDELMAHDREHVEERRRLLKDAREDLTKLGYNARALTTNLRAGHVEDNIPGIDLVARTMADRYPGQFVGHTSKTNDDVERLIDLLTEGSHGHGAQPMSEEDAFETALNHLQEYGPGGSELSGQPLFDDEDEGGLDEWSGGATAPLIPPSPRPPAQIRAAWDRFFSGNEATGGGGSLFGSGDLAGRAALSRLPEGAGVLITEGQFKGATGKIVRDPNNNRVTVEIDNAPHLGQIPVTHEGIEPLSPALSWRTEAASAPSTQGSLLSAQHFLPRRGDESDEVPFSRHERERKMLQTSWANLSPKEMTRRADNVMRFSRQMKSSGPFDSRSFQTAERLNDLVGGATPEELDEALREARDSIRDGRTNENVAIESLMGRFGRNANGNDGRLLSTAFRRALNGNRPIGEVFGELHEEDNDLPDEQQAETLRLQRDAEAIRYSRQYGRPQPEQFRYTKSEINEGAKLASKRGIPFTQAVEMLRRGGR